MKNSFSNPIGIFDSGVGGLTIARAIVNQLPRENIIYFGDTAHFPYGDKSPATIQAYSIKIAHLFLQQQCKLIMIACNSASTAAFDLVKEFVGNQAIVLNVVDPTIQLLNHQYSNQTIGLIGTRQTVNSNVYKKKIDDLNCGIKLTSVATNLLAAAIEEFGDTKVTHHLVKEYLTSPAFNHISGLVLACTHYPVVKNKIAEFFKNKIDIIDPSDAVANIVKQELTKKNQLNTTDEGNKIFYVSDYTESFAAGTKLFFKEDIKLEHYPLWE